MAFVHGRNTVITIGGNDISAFTNSTDFGDETEVLDTTTYGRTRKVYSAGLGDGKVTISGFHDNGVTGPRDVLKPLKITGAPVKLIFRPEGTGSGLPESEVDVLISAYNDSNAVAGMVQWTCDMQMTGPLDETNQ